MQNSNSVFNLNSVFAALISTVALTACSLPAPEQKDLLKEENSAANFSVRSYKADVVPDTVQREFSISDSKRISFEVCLKEISRGKSIQNLQFSIAESAIKKSTDLEGCISWQEDVKYNPAAEAKYLLLERTIQGQGVYRGQRKVSFAFNPWATNDSAVILDAKKAPEGTITEDSEIKQQLVGQNQQQSLKLWVEDARLLALEKSMDAKNIVLNYELRFGPTIQIKNANGDLITRPLTSGAFEGQINLLHRIQEGGTDKWKLLGQSDLISAEIKNGSLALASDIKLSLIPTRGQVYVGLRLIGKGNSQKLKPFEGLYQVGEYDTLKTGGFLKLSSLVSGDPEFSLAKLQAVAPKVDEESYQKPQIEVAPLEFKFLRVSNETTTTRDVSFQVLACLKNGVDQKIIRAQTFKVVKFKREGESQGETTEIKADNSACIQWDITFNTKVYECQRYIKGEVQITNNNLGIDAHIPIIINPWEQWGSAGRDMRRVSPSEKLQTSCSSKEILPSTIQIENYSYSTLSYDYSIDKNLSLGHKKKVLFKIEPKVLTYSNMNNGRESIDRIRDGIYLLKIAVVRNPDYDFKNPLVSSEAKLVTALNGQITTEITWTTNDLKAWGNRNSIAIELYPVDETKAKGQEKAKDLVTLNSLIDWNSGLVSPTFKGPIILNLDEISRVVTRTDLEAMIRFFVQKDAVKQNLGIIDNIISQGELANAALQKSIAEKAGKSTYAAKENLSLLNLTDKKAQTLLGGIAGLEVRYLPNSAMYGIPNRDLKLAKSAGKMDLDAVQNLLRSGTPSAQMSRGLCAWWAYEFLPSMYKNKGGAISEAVAGFVNQTCGQSLRNTDLPFFVFEKVTNVYETGGIKLIAGSNHGISVGTSFSMTNSHTNSVSRTASISTKAGLGFKFFDVFSVGLDTSYQISNSTSDAQSASNGISVGATTSMAVQKNQMEILINKHESCVSVKINPVLFTKDEDGPWYNKRRNLLGIFNRSLSDTEKIDAMTRGLLICEGQINNKPIVKTENFYFINQETSVTQGQDAGDERNRPFFIALRGDSDYAKLMMAMKAQHKMPLHAQVQDELHSSQVTTMSEVFKKGSGAHPAILK